MNKFADYPTAHQFLAAKLAAKEQGVLVNAQENPDESTGGRLETTVAVDWGRYSSKLDQVREKHELAMPGAFITDSLECDCDVGDYDGKLLTADMVQLAELRSRAEYYTGTGAPDAEGLIGLKSSARAVLKRLDRAGF